MTEDHKSRFHAQEVRTWLQSMLQPDERPIERANDWRFAATRFTQVSGDGHGKSD